MEESIKIDTNMLSSSNNDKQISLIDTNKSSNEKENIEIQEKEVKIGNYLIKKTLGKGTFGKVKLGIYLPRNRKVAVKILEKRKLKEEDDIIRLKREFEMLSQFNHPNVITVSEIFETKDAYFTVMEFCEGGELFNYIVQNKYLSEEKSAFFYYQLINGLEYIHSLGIVHRDLKPENLLLTKDHILKIIDFGLSNYFKQTQQDLLETPCGSPCYASPEMLSGNNYDGFKIDIWATGIILFAMLCGFLPFDHKDNDKLFLKILECKIQYPQNLNKDAEDLIKKILVPDPRKRIDIPNIKKHPFYLKGKEIFESNFTIYQVSQDEMTDSDEISSFIYTIDRDLCFQESNQKSALYFSKYRLDQCFNLNAYKKRYNSCVLKYISEEGVKKYIDFEKKINKMKKKNKKVDYKEEIDKLKLENNLKQNNKKNILDLYKIKYNNSYIFQINDIYLFCENMINKYKIEEKNRINKKQESNKIKKINISYVNNTNNKNDIIKYDNINNKIIHNANNNNSNKNNSNKNNSNNNSKQKVNKNKISNKKSYIEINENNNDIVHNNKIIMIKDLIKEKEKKIKNANTLNIKKDCHLNNSQLNYMNNSQNKKSINKTNIKNNNKNNKIKVNIKKKFSININKLFINNNKIPKVNKLPQNVMKFKKYNRKIKSTSNDPKKNNIKNIIDNIKKQSLKAKINIINKQNITHHHTTNITNMTQRNYISNVIINNYKNNDHKNDSSSRNKSKILSSPENQKEKNIINEYLQKLSEQNQPIKNNVKNWNFKINLQKIILKDENYHKKICKQYSHNKNSKDKINIDDKILNYLTVRDKKINDKSKENEGSKTIPNTNDKKRRVFKNKVSNINTYNINNNVKYFNTNNNNNKIYENSFGLSLISNNNLNLTNNSKMENKYINSHINNSIETEQVNKDNKLYRKKKLEKILSTNINFNLNLEKKLKRNKINNSSIDNTFSNRSYNYNMNKVFDNNNKMNNSNQKNNKNNSGFKKLENIKKKNLYLKNNINHQKCKINLKEIFGTDSNNNKKDNTISLSLNYQKQIQSQRNNPSSILSKTHKNINFQNYLNTARNYDYKNANISYNIGKKYISNLAPKFEKLQLNNIRNKDLIHINLNYNCLNRMNLANITSDNIKNTKNLKKKSSLYPKKTINTNILNTTNYNYIPNKTTMNKKRVNTNIFLDKYAESKKLLSSLKKRINLKLNLINNNMNNNINSNMNIMSYIDNKLENKTHNNSMKMQENDNGNIKNSSIITKFNSKQFKMNNNTIDNLINKNNCNYNDFINIKNHKKMKSMKETLLNKKNKIKPKTSNYFKNLNIDNNNNNNVNIKNNVRDIKMYVCNTDGSSNNTNNAKNINYLNIMDTKYNTINSSRRVHQHQFSNIINLKKNNINKKIKINCPSKIK